MKVDVDSSALADAVSWTTRVIDSRPANPLLAGIRLHAQDGQLYLSAFNYEVSARHGIDAGVDEPGDVLVLGRLLADITKTLPSDRATLTTAGSSLTIRSGKSVFTLQLMPVDDYPELPPVPDHLGQIDAQTFIQAVSQASVAISREESRPVLTGIRMQFHAGHLVMTSTDRFRLARSHVMWTPVDENVDVDSLVRGSLLRDLARSLDDHQNVVIDGSSDDSTLMAFENAQRISTTQLIDGEFPAVDRLFADEYPIQAVIDRQVLLAAIKRVALVAERNAPIRLALAGQELTLSAGASDEAQATEILDIDLDGDDITVAFNPSYLIEGLSAITEPFVRMKMTTAVKPVEFNGQQEQDSDESLDYRYLLVPMRFLS